MESILRVMGDYGKAVRPETIALKRNAKGVLMCTDAIKVLQIAD